MRTAIEVPTSAPNIVINADPTPIRFWPAKDAEIKIVAVLPYDKKQILKLLPNKKANITIRNFHKTVAQIRKELKIKDGGDSFLFFTTNIHNKFICMYCKKL
jgi:hypothetical protein